MIDRAKPPVFDRLAALADPIRSRLLLVLERHELTVGELQAVLQLPQSTVSRHLKSLVEARWVTARGDGASNRYRMATRTLDSAARKLWQSVRDEVAGLAAAQRDGARIHGVLAERHTRSQAFFAGSAAQWDKLRAELFGERAELFALLGLLDPSATLGDLGCGAGHLSEAVAPFVGRVIAVDESPAMLKAARARLQQHENVELREGTIEKLPLADRALDIAVLSLVLHYVADPALALAEARRVLAKGGRLLIVDMLEHDRAELVAEMGHIWPGFDAARVVSMLEEAGFTDIRLAPLPAHPKAKGPTAFVAAARRS